MLDLLAIGGMQVLVMCQASSGPQGNLLPAKCIWSNKKK